jgi:hypothetical protein
MYVHLVRIKEAIDFKILKFVPLIETKSTEKKEDSNRTETCRSFATRVSQLKFVIFELLV